MALTTYLLHEVRLLTNQDKLRLLRFLADELAREGGAVDPIIPTDEPWSETAKACYRGALLLQEAFEERARAEASRSRNKNRKR